MLKLMSATLLAISIALWTGSVQAQEGLDRCDDILKGDLFNRTSRSTNASSSEQQTYTDYLFSMSAERALDEYKNAYKNRQTQGTDVNVAGSYEWIAAKVKVDHDYDRLIDDDVFKKKFGDAQQEYQNNISSSSAKQSSLISLYSSQVRDPVTITAWEKCMERSPETGLFAYGYRDESGGPYIVVIWSPGNLGAANPVIDVRFAVADADMTIESAGQTSQVAMGGGASFPVHFKNENDRRAKSDGFTVLVNGELRQGDRLVFSSHSEAVVPRNLGPVPCSLVFTANKIYELGVLDKTNTFKWGFVKVATAGAAPGPPESGAVYAGRMIIQGKSAPITLKVSGTEVTIIDHETQRDRVAVAGECTGQGVRGHFVETAAGQTLVIGIRPQR